MSDERESLSRYIILRLLLLIPTFIGVTVISFAIIKLTPGNPLTSVIGFGTSGSAAQAAKLSQELGLGQPLYVQYLLYIWRIIHLNFGNSISQQVPVVILFEQALPNTLYLISVAMLFALAIGIPIGLLAGVRRNTIADQVTRIGSILAASLPDYWLGLMLLIIFAFYLRLFPVGGNVGPTAVVLPALTLGIGLAGLIVRLMRSSMLQEIHQNYIRTARSKGLKEGTIIFRHALRNAILPVITVVALQLGYLLAGDFFVEYVFAWPGVGRLVVSAILVKDYPIVQAFLLFAATFYVALNLLVDILYVIIDPRIRLTGK
jgi:ABC-type dipeptide/oligopeptide/nickel transport system permease component